MPVARTLVTFDPSVETDLQPIYPQIGDAVYSISPGMHDAARALVAERNLEFLVDPVVGGFLFDGAGSSFAPGVRVGLGALERIWASIFGYFVLFEIFEKQFNASLKGYGFPQTPHPDLRAAIELLRWATSDIHVDRRQEWPRDLPSPRRPGRMCTIRKVEPLFLRAVGWMFGHELGHFACGHLDPKEEAGVIVLDVAARESAHRMEHQADAWAHDRATTPKETWGAIASVCSIAFGIGIVGGICRVVTDEHPPISDRMRRFYASYIEPLWTQKHSAYNTALYAAIAPLHAQLYLNDWNPDMVAFGDFNEYLGWWEQTMDRLANPLE